MFNIIEETVHVIFRVEHHQVVDLFADPDVTDREVQLLRDRDRDPTFRGSIQFRQNYPRDICDSQELPRLLESVLSGYRVDYQQCLMRCLFYFPAGDAFHFLELGHQVRFIVKSARRIYDQHVRAS